MATTPVLRIYEPVTGAALDKWLYSQVGEYRSGLTSQIWGKLIWMPTRIEDFWSKSSTVTVTRGSVLVEQEEPITDPKAQIRWVQSDFVDMARNLTRLALVAKVLIPDIREMTQRERDNLRQYYRKVYRKV